ncbi:MAG: helix-turn-helix transcriptional regulator [Peptostreptococcaceae bacterium]|jgi:putative transcriptional regulator|uniref:helix-turn-helix transcriptional regulator n=1 Tax=Intestinibacter bartlettii TaxID=261299 RepID=UPI000821D5E1|nr:helix-turn-helix transcriptional regulator [Intestinibacter bartlettii]MDU1252905.1 helix-turn-helix transcriptional regulator [Peptostreptococcaceae bacterium]SCI39817.1 Predicted transcriptional regulator [uncultured Clostridium sp.]
MNVNILKSLRVKQGLKQQDVANYLGITVSAYNYKENGKRKFSIDEAIKLARLLKCDIEDIFLN